MNSFNKPIIPQNDTERLAALASYQILDTQPERFFNNLAEIMARCFDAPIALVSFVDKERVFFKANVGMPGVNDIPRGISLCSLAILDKELTIFENAETEPCLLANPLVAGEFGLRFYAGAPIITAEGFPIGTVCIVDKAPREFSPEDQDLLARFASSAMKAMDDRKERLPKYEMS